MRGWNNTILFLFVITPESDSLDDAESSVSNSFRYVNTISALVSWSPTALSKMFKPEQDVFVIEKYSTQLRINPHDLDVHLNCTFTIQNTASINTHVP